jgi:hypothetical protein
MIQLISGRMIAKEGTIYDLYMDKTMRAKGIALRPDHGVP